MITADKENRFSRFPTWTSSGLREEIAETPVRVVPRRVEDTGDRGRPWPRKAWLGGRGEGQKEPMDSGLWSPMD